MVQAQKPEVSKSLPSYITPLLFVFEATLLEIFLTLFPGSAGSGFLAIIFLLICGLMLIVSLKIIAGAVISPPHLTVILSSALIPRSPASITFELGDGYIPKVGELHVFDIEGLVKRLYL